MNEIWYLLGATDFVMISTAVSPKDFLYASSSVSIQELKNFLGTFQYINTELLHAAREMYPKDLSNTD